MHPVIHILALLGILGLTLGSLTGCGEKRINVATISGAPGEEIELASIDTTSSTDPGGVEETSVEESSLSGQIPAPEETQLEPLNFSHEPAAPQKIDPASNQGLAIEDARASNLSEGSDTPADSGLLGKEDSFADLSGGPNIDTQSGSSLLPDTQAGQVDSTTSDGSSPLTSSLPNDSVPAFQDDFSGVGMERIPDALVVAKAEPSDMMKQRLDNLKRAEKATLAAGLEDVFFEFDSWSLTPEGKQVLDRDMVQLKRVVASKLIIEGHADQRGTQAYNIVLGKKRAVAIQDYLAESGLDASRLAIISYGKDKPFCHDPSETCHFLNRRGHLLIQNP
jgi:peptidoglycan-associated lipoprotein